MPHITLRDGTIIGGNAPPYFIAEVNTSHNGDTDTAKKMIDAAKITGCDCVKFQSFTPSSINSKSFYDKNPIAKRFFNKLALAEESLLALAAYSRERGIAFSSTPYSAPEADFLLNKCDAPFIKVSSMEIDNLPYLEYIGQTGAPVVLSTGMADMAEIERAVDTIKKTGNKNICILHCISLYPAAPESINLRNITGLRDAFPDYPIGFSDHSLGAELACAAVALGAALIEKHFTLDKTKIGMDNQMALSPEETAHMVTLCKNVYNALGETNRAVSGAELEQRLKMRRSVTAARDIKKGGIITADDLCAKRPGTGISPARLRELMGKKALCDIEADTLICESDIE